MVYAERFLTLVVATTLVTGASMTAPALTEGPSDRSLVISKLAQGTASTIDMKEVTASAERKFVELDTDRDGLLDASELAGIATASEQHRADYDKDRALNKAEYLSLVKREFEAADTDRDGLLDDKELSTQAGIDLVALLAY